MESRIKIAGHPVHPMLIVFPLGLLATAVIFDIAYVITRNADLSVFSFWALVAGSTTFHSDKVIVFATAEGDAAAGTDGAAEDVVGAADALGRAAAWLEAAEADDTLGAGAAAAQAASRAVNSTMISEACFCTTTTPWCTQYVLPPNAAPGPVIGPSNSL